MWTEESIVSAQKWLEKMASTDEAGKASVKKATKHLVEGASALKMHQKHIWMEDCSKYGWIMVCHYQSKPLALDSEGKKHLHRAEKDAKKDFKQLEAKTQQWGDGAGSS